VGELYGKKTFEINNIHIEKTIIGSGCPFTYTISVMNRIIREI